VPQDQLGLFDTPPSPRQVRLSLVLAAPPIVAALLVLPVRNVPLHHVNSYIPTVETVMCLGDMIIASLFYAQACVFRSRALLLLASAFAYTGLLFIPHALSFPGAFGPEGWFGGGVNTTGWVAMFRRIPFPIVVIFYVLMKRSEAAAAARGEERPPVKVAGAVISAGALAAAATLLATVGHDLLPSFYQDPSQVIYASAVVYESMVLAPLVVGMVMLFRARNSVLDVWLLTAFSGLVIQSLLNMTLHSRFSAGWYCLYAVMTWSHLVVLLALVTDFNRLYVRLAQAMAARNRERENRLVTVDAATAAIAHEVGQPLTALRIHTSAGLNWLTRPEPNSERAIESLQAAVDAGQRTAEVTRSIRSIFARRPGVMSEFNLNDLVHSTVALLSRELEGEEISLQLALDKALPPIVADRVQIQQVIVNLITNAVESLAETKGRQRLIAIRSSTLEDDDVLLEVRDSGLGIEPHHEGQLFEAFFTTKESGVGLGLSLCRSIVESHGGHLWASQYDGEGATFHLRLPRKLHAVSKVAT
jgi:signal transduction histidine kinase